MDIYNNSGKSMVTQKVPTFVYNAIGITMALLFVIALIENILVLTIYKSNRKLQSKTNLWIIAVIICDLLIVINAFPVVTIASFAQNFIFGPTGCTWDGFIITLLGTSSIFLLTGLSVHRYVIMVRTTKTRTKEKTFIIISILSCFCFGFFWAVSPLIGWGSYSLEGIGISCAPNWRSRKMADVTYTIAMYIGVLFLPLMTMAYCYISILLKIWREKRNHSAWIQQRSVKRDIRVTISVALTIVSFLVSWAPYAVVGILESFFNMDLLSISPMLVQLPCLLAKTACIWNPLVYVCHNKQFRDAFIQKYGFLKICTGSRRNGSDPSENTSHTCKNVFDDKVINGKTAKLCDVIKYEHSPTQKSVTIQLLTSLPESIV